MRPSSDQELPQERPAAAIGVCLSAVPYWYLAGLLTVIGVSLGPYLVPHPSFKLRGDQDWLDRFTWMDGRWYKEIVVEGYHYVPAKHSNVAFFPVYPFLARAVMTVARIRPEAALLAVSNASFLAALALLALYVRDRGHEQTYFGSPATVSAGERLRPCRLADSLLAVPSDWVVLAAALFPTGCFFRFAYSESTCMFLIVLAMYAMRRCWPHWTVALLVGLGTAARPVGVALLAPFAIYIIRSGGSRYTKRSKLAELGRASEWIGRHSSAVADLFHRRLISAAFQLAIYLPLGCWGLGAFLAYEYYAFGDPLVTVKAQGEWRVRPAVSAGAKMADLATLEPIRSVYDRRSASFWGNDKHGVPWLSLQFANPLFFLAAIALIALGALRRWLTVDEVMLSAVLLLMPYLTRAHEMGMRSMGRFVIVVFPIYIVLGHILTRLPGPIRAGLLAVCGLFVGIYSALYAGGYVIF